MTKWIDIDHRQPTETGYVLVFANDIVSSWIEVVNAYICPEYGGVIFEDRWTGEDYAPIVTHWAELPDPPE